MRFPWRSLRSGFRWWWCHTPSAAHALIGIHVGVFVAQTVTLRALPAGSGGTPLEFWGALSGETLRTGQFWRLGTHLFLHDSALALLASALLLLFAGRNLEAILGRRHFLTLYFLAGITTGLVRALGALLPNGGMDTGAQPIIGDLGAALAVLVAFTTIMPELDFGALIFLPAPSVRLKARFLAAAALLAPAILFLIFTAAPATQAVVGDADGTLRLVCLGALAGVCSGWVYARSLGFGRRWPLNASPRTGGRRRSNAHGSETWARPQDAAPWSPEKSVAFAGAGNNSNNNSASVNNPPPASGNNSPSSSNNAGALASTTASSAAAAAAVAVAAPVVTERERRMSTREYIEEAVDPILEKITRDGLGSLTEQEHRVLEICREKIVGPRA
jgi:membrane associated rhomboid family serine protease